MEKCSPQTDTNPHFFFRWGRKSPAAFGKGRAVKLGLAHPTVRRTSISIFLTFVMISQHPEPDVHLFSAARPSSFGGDVVSCEAGWHGFRKVGCSGSSNSGAYPNLPRDILCLTYGMAEAPSHCPSPHQRIHLSRAYTKARSPTIQK